MLKNLFRVVIVLLCGCFTISDITFVNRKLCRFESYTIWDLSVCIVQFISGCDGIDSLLTRISPVLNSILDSQSNGDYLFRD